jgi:hypothetical protein
MPSATVVAGNIVAVTVMGREFPVPIGCEAQLDTGGVENTVGTTGSGASYITQAPYPWTLASIDLRISEDRGDLGFLAKAFNTVVGLSPLTAGLAIQAPPSGRDRKFLSEVVAQGRFIPMTVTLADGSVYAGRGTIVGRLAVDTKTAVLRTTFMGDGQMVKQ